MLVDKIFREDETVECLYKSSNILMSVWDPKKRLLEVTFNYGGKYSYSNVDPKDYLRFEMDKSQGEVFNKHIKLYKTQNLGKVDVSVLKQRLTEMLTPKTQEGEQTELL